MIEYRLEIHGSKLDNYADCPLRGFAESMKPELKALGYQFFDTPQYVTPLIGSAIHAGVADLHDSKKNEDFGANASIASQVARKTLHTLIENTPDIVYTKHFPDDVEILYPHIDAYIDAYMDQVLPIRPMRLVEYGFEGCFTDDICYETTLDLYTEDDILADLKTGKEITPAKNQMGFYLLLLMQQGYTPKGVVLDYMLREDKRNNAGAVIHTPIYYDHNACLEIVKNTLSHLISDFREFKKTNSLKHIRVNPRSSGCNNRICSLYGTSTCTGWQK